MMQEGIYIPSSAQAALFAAAQKEIGVKNADVEIKFELSGLPRWSFIQGSQEIEFAEHKGPAMARARFIIAGVMSFQSDTFAWGWTIPSVENKTALHKVRERGEKDNIQTLIEPYVPCNSDKARELAEVAGYILEADTVKKFSNIQGGIVIGAVYLLLYDIRKVVH